MLVEDHLRWFWWQVCDKFRGVEEVTITGCEKTVLQEFGLEGERKPGEEEDEDTEMANDVDDEQAEFLYDETLYSIALRTYWDLRKQEPEWVPPRWRVWGANSPRKGFGRRVNGCSGDE